MLDLQNCPADVNWKSSEYFYTFCCTGCTGVDLAPPEASSFRRPTTPSTPLEAERNPCPQHAFPAHVSLTSESLFVTFQPLCT